ncbi:MAG: tetratricopeptide repeat protein [Gemmatimonadota bacterium]|nr:tetratricopeptide repeat protein [Gemmatimonadota bacterium]MDE3127120.1 tetratricopeptide repeat protein [Gemmatimonadota bacterium]
MTAPSAGHKPSAEEAVLEWFQRNARSVAVAVVVIAAGAGAYWFYNRSVDIKNQNAEQALNTALQSVQSGNKALATSDLQKVVTRYGDTQSGIEAGLLMAQLDFNDQKVPEGVTLLEGLTRSGAAKLQLASIYSLMGDGQMQGGQFAAAAKSYQQAVDASGSDLDKSYQLSKQARALALSGNTAAAVVIWKKLASDPKAQGIGAEARVRLGEAEAKAATKS